MTPQFPRSAVDVDIVVPFYRNARLVGVLCDSLEAVAKELIEVSCSIVAVNDSPGDESLRAALADAQVRLNRSVPFEILENEGNIGFVRSANAGIRRAVERGRDVLLLNSDTIVFPGAVREIAHVAYADPMIAFVSPRSNHATICSLPQHRDFEALLPDEAHRMFQEVAAYLPQYHFAPTAVGFCLYMKRSVLAEFGLFDEGYSPGYNEENDLIMRANRCGFRAAIANRAFVYHSAESSFEGTATPRSFLEERNALLLRERYPEYEPAIERYLESPPVQGRGAARWPRAR